ADGNGGFRVRGTNTYVQAGNYALRVTIHDVGGATISVVGAASIADAVLSATPMPVAAVEAAPFTRVVATFVDADPAGAASSYTATITWGDGHTSAGTITADGNGGFRVTGTNT